MDDNKHPHLRLINTHKEAASPPEPDLQYYKHDPTYNYDLDMPKSDLIMLVVAGILMGTLVGVVVVGIWGGLSLL
tara:strand:+ start:83 stop:307 length:225 start_codon:yes stop_codon:yes gene_type:complete